MFDLDSDGELSVPEVESMVGELYGHNGGGKCLMEAVEFAEQRGGALKLNSFIAFTASHQMLLFPMFKLQHKLQKRVFGTGYWKRIEKRAKDDYENANKNEFNPRHVQILLRTYQTGGAVAVLTHTGDPNQGLREWYENEKEMDTKGCRDKEVDMMADSPGLPEEGRSVGGKKISDKGRNLKEKTLDRIRRLKGKVRQPLEIYTIRGSSFLTRSSNQHRPNKEQGKSCAPVGGAKLLPTAMEDANRRAQPTESKPTIPKHVARDLERIRAKRARSLRQKEGKQPGVTNESDISPTTAGQKAVVPSKVAEDLKRIRAKRTKKMLQQRHSSALRQSKPNTRQREAGSIFFNQQTGRRGWLE